MDSPIPSRAQAPSGWRGSNPKVDALIELLEKTGPVTILFHSAAGPTGYETACERGDLVQGLVTVEVTGTSTDLVDIKRHFVDKQLIAVYRDNFNLCPMRGRYRASAMMVNEFPATGRNATMIWLPEKHMQGNSHLLMQDTNNDEIAEMIMQELGTE